MVKVKQLEDKDFEPKGGKYFDIGVHEVYINNVSRGVTPNTGSEYIELEVLGSEDQTTNVRLYLTEKAAERSLAILGAIAVHNVEGDAQKQKVRDTFKAIDDTDSLDEKFLAKFENMQAWILTEEDKTGQQKPNGGYYLRSNLYSYEPSPRKQTAEDIMSASTPASKDDVDAIPFA